MIASGKEGEIEDKEMVQRLFPDEVRGGMHYQWIDAQDKLRVLAKDEASDVIKLFLDGNVSEALNQLEHLL